MSRKPVIVLVMVILLVAVGLVTYAIYPITTKTNPVAVPSSVNLNQSSNQEQKPEPKIDYEKFKDLKVIDAHNHDASGRRYETSLRVWDRYFINKVVLFGNTSEPAAIGSDELAWEAYQKYPDRFYPFFSGFDMHNKSSLETVTTNLEKGYYGIGEVIAASTYSPIASKVEWKGQHPMDGYLPDIYKLCVQYKAPILLHIDPPNGRPIQKLEEALTQYPNTMIIFGHANVGNSPSKIQDLLKKYPNLYIDFFVGYTVANANNLEDYVPIIKEYPDRFFVSSDSAFDLTYDKAYSGIYQLLALLDTETAKKVAHDNMERIIEAEPATNTQLQKIKELSKKAGQTVDTSKLNKRKANELIFKLEGQQSNK